MNKNILLIGFMGTGKTTTSKILSEKTNMPEIDMDAYIVEKNGVSIAEMFEQKGEDYFRDRETECLIDILKNDGVIVSCGGGVVVRDINVKYMKNQGVIVLLTATPETIYNRVKNSNDRPILNGNMNIEYIEKLMEKRKSRYLEVADIIIETDGKTPEEVVTEIIKKVME